MKIPFVKAPDTGNQLEYLIDSFKTGFHSGNGKYTKLCHEFIVNKFNVKKTLLTTSCTDALEMCAFLIDAKPDDEFIVPSYTFSSTANAFASKGLKPVYCDIREDTLNIDENKIENLITKKTKAIVVIHYAGIPSEMNKINELGLKYNIPVIEDAAQAFNSKYYDRYAGSLSDLGTYSFHSTKSYSSGEGGALTINHKKYFERSEYLWEKGTDRSLVIQGLKNKYSWVDYGSSFLPSDLLASILYAQLEKINDSQKIRKKVHDNYNETFSSLKKYGLNCLFIPEHIESNYHAFWITFNNSKQRDLFLKESLKKNISPYIGYMPLHSSPMGRKLGHTNNDLPVTNRVADTICRLPFYLMNDQEIKYTNDTLFAIALKILKN